MDGRMTAEHIVKDLLLNKSSNTTTITVGVNAGGIGVWIAVTCCVAMLAVNMVIMAVVMDHSRKIDSLGDYLQAIYVQAPHLKSSDTPK